MRHTHPFENRCLAVEFHRNLRAGGAGRGLNAATTALTGRLRETGF